MANPKIFVSSTCYDLNIVRSQLRGFINSFGYEPIMSEYADVLYDPRSHTHTSCLKEVENCDMLILIIGSRFGGKAIPNAIAEVNFETLREGSLGQKIFEDTENLSITQLEVLKAIENELPIFTFIESSVYHDHLVYEKNKENELIKSIVFPSIDKTETAKYIFEFINFLRLRNENNSITSFSKMEDIELYLRKQWSGLFQRLLFEQRNKINEDKRMEYLTNQIADIKTAIMTSISSSDLKDTARGALKYRRLIDFISSLSERPTDFILQDITWNELLQILDVEKIIAKTNNNLGYNNSTYIILRDGNLLEARIPYKLVMDFIRQWDEFRMLNLDSKQAIVNAVLDDPTFKGRSIIRYVKEGLDELDKQQIIEEDIKDIYKVPEPII